MPASHRLIHLRYITAQPKYSSFGQHYQQGLGKMQAFTLCHQNDIERLRRHAASIYQPVKFNRPCFSDSDKFFMQNRGVSVVVNGELQPSWPVFDETVGKETSLVY